MVLHSRLTHLMILILYLFVCLVVCLLSHSIINAIICRRHHYRWRAANLYICSALVVFEQWGFFSASHLLWHGTSVYNGHLRRLMTLTPIAERLAVVELSLPAFTTKVCRGWGSNNQPFTCRAHALTVSADVNIRNT